VTDENRALPVVAWLGLGAMGLPMVQRVVAASYRVRAYDPHRERLDAAGPDYAAADPADAARGAQVLVVMVATPQQADEALVGRGALEALDPGARVVVLSTVGTAWVKELAGRVPPGTRVVDAPVSGGVVRARDGSLLVMASGLDAVSGALLDTLGDVVEVGPDPGQGQAMKMVNQVLCGVHIAAAAEALALAEALGLDPARALETVRRGAGASFMLDDRGRRMVDPGSEVRSSLALFVKDLGLVADESRRTGLNSGVAAAAARLFSEAAAARGADHDDTELYDYLRARPDWSR